MLITLFPIVAMSRVTRSKGTQHEVVSRPSPITKVPLEIITEIFKFAILSSEDARSHGVKALCLVDKCWNRIANATPDLWTKITLVYPLYADRLSAIKKWLEASEPKVIDLEVYYFGYRWSTYPEDNWLPPEKSDAFPDVITVFTGSERRWRSISVGSDMGGPTCRSLGPWVSYGPPELESIYFEWLDEFFGLAEDRFISSRSIPLPITPDINEVLMPKLREVSICAAGVNWEVATTSFKNLRKLEIRDLPRGAGPTFEQFSALLAASPRLETLNLSGYHPARGNLPIQTRTPHVHLPVLKSLVFAWTNTDLACDLLTMFQIPETLETLSLANINCGLGVPRAGGSTRFVYLGGSSQIFKFFADFGSGDSKNKDPSIPRISVAGLKSLSMSWLESDSCDMITFLRMAQMVEEIRLTNVSQAVLQSIVDLAKTRSLPSLKRLYLRWICSGEHVSAEARPAIDFLRDLGLQVIVKEFAGEVEGFSPIGLKAKLAKEDAEWAA